MAAIGLFIYEISIWDKETNSKVNFDKINVENFIEDFVKSKVNDQVGQIDERTWRLEPKAATGYVSHGIVHYGTHGISSKIKDSSGQLRYDRKKNDIEEIPLYYQFWLPSSGLQGFAIFQSYGGRSCASVLRTSLTEAFKARFENYRITSKKIIPTDENSFSEKTVNRFWLMQKSFERFG